MATDLPSALAYVAALTGDPAAVVTWQTFDDGADKRRDLAAILHGRLLDVADRLAAANAAGAGIYACVAETDLRGRKAANVTAIRALFIDVDDGEPRAWHLPPSAVVISAGGPHAYWCVGDCALGEFRAAQQRLAAHYRSDPRVHDLPRVMRVPGYAHRKRGPIMVRLHSAPGHVYSTAEVLAWIAELPVPPVRRVYAPQPGPARGWRSIDPVAAFAGAGLLGRQLAADRWAVTCPWDHEHTRPQRGEPDSSSVLWAPSAGRPGSYLCSHAHCAGRYLAHALREIGSWAR